LQHTSAMLASLPTPARSALQRSRKTPKSNKVTFEAEQTKRKRPAIVRSGANEEETSNQSFEAQETRWNDRNEEVVDMTSFLFETCGLILTGDVTFLRHLSRWHKLRQEASTLYSLASI
jgi:hypothetical protein